MSLEFWPERIKRRSSVYRAQFKITAIIKDESSNILFKIKNEPYLKGKEKLDAFMRDKLG